MREIYQLVFASCVVLILAEVIRRLFPGDSGALVHGLAVLCVAASVCFGIFRAGFSLDFDFAADFNPEEAETEQLYAENGARLLSERLYAILEAADVQVAGGAEGVEIWYTQDDDGNITVDSVHVRLVYGAEPARAVAVLRGVLTDAIQTEVYIDDG